MGILGNAQAEETKEAGFLSSISEELKVKFSQSNESINPEAIATSLDTTVESTQEILMTEIEKKLLDQEPVKMLIDEIKERAEDETEELIEEEIPEEKETEVEPKNIEINNVIVDYEESFDQEL